MQDYHMVDRKGKALHKARADLQPLQLRLHLRLLLELHLACQLDLRQAGQRRQVALEHGRRHVGGHLQQRKEQYKQWRMGHTSLAHKKPC